MNREVLTKIEKICTKKANDIACNFQLVSYQPINDKFIEVQGNIYYGASGKKVSALFDINGNEIIPISDSKNSNFKVVFENGNNLLIEYYTKENKTDYSKCSTLSFEKIEKIEKLVHYKYNEKENKLTEISTFNNDRGYLILYEKYGNNDKTILVINSYDEKRDANKKQLYSISKGEFVSPKVENFTLLKENEENLVFGFTDRVYSYDKIDDQSISTIITGAITSNGELFDRIYIDYFNREKICGLNGHDNFMQYRALKNHISRDLDIEVDKQLEEKRRKENSFNNYMVKVKKFYQG